MSSKRKLASTQEAGKSVSRQFRDIGLETPRKRTKVTKKCAIVEEPDSYCESTPKEAIIPIGKITENVTKDVEDTWKSLCEKAISFLQLSSIPQNLVAREKEKAAIKEWWVSCLDCHKCGSMYIAGAPGTGKTALVDEIQRELIASNYKSRVIKMNCMDFKDAHKVYSMIKDHMKTISSQDDVDDHETAKQWIEKRLQKLYSQKKMIVLILDEIDQLLVSGNRHQEILYQIFEWAQSPESTLVLIGIANSLDLTERFLPYLALKNCAPKILNFERYSKQQIQSILSHRLSLLNDNSQSTNENTELCKKESLLVDPKALDVICTRVGSHSGDIRVALDILRKSVEELLVRLEKEGLHDKGLSHPVQPVKVMDAVKVTTQFLGSPTVLVIQKLPTHDKIALAGALLMLRQVSQSNNKPTYGMLWDYYTSCVRKIGLTPVDSSDFKSNVDNLVASGLMNVVACTTSKSNPSLDAKNMRASKVELIVSESDILFAFKDQKLLMSMLASE